MKTITGVLVGVSFVCVLGWPAARAQQPPLPRPGGQGRSQEGPTKTGEELQKFNMDYFLGEWTFEGIVPDSPLGAGGQITGTEVVKKVWDGRYYELAIKGESPDGPFTGVGVLTYLDTPAGQYATRYEVTRGMALLKAGLLGGDLGGRYTHFWETPSFERNGATVRLRGQSFFSSLNSYRLKTEISIDRSAFQNFGTVLYTKQMAQKSSG